MVGKRVKIKCLDNHSIDLMTDLVGRIGVISEITDDKVYVKIPGINDRNNGFDYYWEKESLHFLDTKLGRILYK